MKRLSWSFIEVAVTSAVCLIVNCHANSAPDMVIKYFGGTDRIPPRISGSYGGQTDILAQSGDSLIFHCSAFYPIKWQQIDPDPNGEVIMDEPSSFNREISIRINHIKQTTSITCIDARNNTSILNATVRVIISGRNTFDRDSPVYTARSSMLRVTIASSSTLLLQVQLKRRSITFKQDLIIRWYKTYVSPLKGQTGGDVTKELEWTYALWKWSQEKSEFHSSYTATLNDLPTSGNYTCVISNAQGQQFHTQMFHVVIIAKVRIKLGFRVYALKDGQEPIDHISRVLTKQPVNTRTDIFSNKSYLLVCEFHGNPLLPQNAFMFRNKFDCPPLRVHRTANGDTVTDHKPFLIREYEAVNSSSDGTNCTDFPISTSGRVSMLPIRNGTDTMILSAVITPATRHILYGCFYRLGPKQFPAYRLDDKTIHVRQNASTETESAVQANVIEPSQDEIIIGDNVTLRCRTDMRIYFPLMYWKVNDRYITRGDDPGPGYRTNITNTHSSTIFHLTIFNINQSSVYTCRGQKIIASHGIEQDIVVNVTVHTTPLPPYFGPTTTDNTTTITRTVGPGAVDLTCEAGGSPEPKVKWIKWPLPMDTANATNLPETNETIHVPLVDTSKSGVYECIIYNRLGQNKRQFSLVIREPISFTVIVLSFVIAIIMLLLAGVVANHCRTLKKKRKLEALQRELREQAAAGNRLDESKSVNEQIDALGFNMEMEMKENIDFVVGDIELGKGAYGIVRVGDMLLEGGKRLTVAVKSPRDGMSEEHQRALLAEMSIMMHIGRHVNVLCLLGVQTSKMPEGILYGLTEYCRFGSLSGYLRKHAPVKVKLPSPASQLKQISAKSEEKARVQLMHGYKQLIIKKQLEQESLSVLDLLSYSYQVANGMTFLSAKNVVHRDLALRNVLLTERNFVKIADFGLALTNSPDQRMIWKQRYMRVPLKWQDIDTLTNPGHCSTKSDVYSFGVVLWEIFSYGEKPNKELSTTFTEIVRWKNENRLDPPVDCPSEMVDLMNRCWDDQPDNRPPFATCKQAIKRAIVGKRENYWETMKMMLCVEDTDNEEVRGYTSRVD